ncbi:DUF6906 family protein [Clostridium senegalense]|uniref:DUF6906 family protein n=1 Tax=Clostridium senegalense TaxID=1465809 RepID=UPI0002E988A6|nr:hypothetical protein [Clostridium senegalense]
MKNGKKLTRKQKFMLLAKGLNFKNYLCIKNTSTLHEFINRETGEIFKMEGEK